MENPKIKIGQTLKKILKTLPSKPGVYKMIDEEGKVIYVGKAKDLKKRVSHYFQKSKTATVRTQKLIENIADIKYTVVDSELEALILELNLIKELHPKYNVLLKDDKNYVYIKITDYEDFPRIQIVRKIDDKKATYYGPKTAKHKVEKTFKTLKKVFPFRHCTLDIKAIGANKTLVTHKTIKYPCLDHYIKRCCAPCIPNCTKEEYAEIIRNVKRFLEGHHEEIIKSLKVKMANLAQNRKFEEAAKLRDRIKSIEEILERQKISDPNRKDTDVFNYTIANNKAFFNLFQIRDGKLINQENFILQAQSIQEEDDDDEAKQELLESFLSQYYEKTTNIPKEILLPHDPANKNDLEKFISKEKGTKVEITTPKKGEKSHLLELSYKNAKVFAERNRTNWEEEGDHTKNLLEELKSQFNLKKPPKRIECYDISHLAGTDTTGSMIVFINGVQRPQDYRKFRILTVVDKPDDYKSLEELLTRRLAHLKDESSEYNIKKAVKKDEKTIEEIIEKEKMLIDCRDINYKTFFTAKKDGKIYGFVREKIIGESHKISSLWISKKARGQHLGHKLLKALIKASKAKRFYLNCQKTLKDYYESIGFMEIKKLPKELEADQEYWNKLDCVCSHEKGIWFAYDNTKKQDKSFDSMPDLIIIDGGKGQLSTAEKVLKSFKLTLPVISIAKEREEIFIPGQKPGQKDSLHLDRTNQILRLIQRARDEAHRFAISYNKHLRRKRLNK
ncbi:MAG: excinuclease ABC subunit UvrC [Candidatus Gracilibacteria bacterium]